MSRTAQALDAGTEPSICSNHRCPALCADRFLRLPPSQRSAQLASGWEMVSSGSAHWRESHRSDRCSGRLRRDRLWTGQKTQPVSLILVPIKFRVGSGRRTGTGRAAALLGRRHRSVGQTSLSARVWRSAPSVSAEDTRIAAVVAGADRGSRRKEEELRAANEALTQREDQLSAQNAGMEETTEELPLIATGRAEGELRAAGEAGRVAGGQEQRAASSQRVSGGEGRGTGRIVPLQIRIPGQHVARITYAAQQHFDPCRPVDRL